MTIPTLAERIEAIWEEIDEFIDARVDEQAVPGVPREVLRNLLLNKGRCRCTAYRAIKDEQ